MKNKKSVQARLEGVWKLSYRNDLIYITNKMWGEYYYTVVEEQEDSIVIDVNEKGHVKRYTVNLNKDYPDSIGILEYTGGDNNYTAIGIGTRFK